MKAQPFSKPIPCIPTKEDILDNHYKTGMHWKTVNRGNVLDAMEVYAMVYAQTKSKGLEEENMRLKTVLSKVKNFHEGNGKYNFSHMNDNDRGNASFDEWQNIYYEIKEFFKPAFKP